MRILAVIPARYASQRLPGKLLLELGGKPLFQHVCEAAEKAMKVEKVIVASGDQEILDRAREAGIECFESKRAHSNGSSRCFEAFEGVGEEYDVLINLQGDEPFIRSETIDELARIFETEEEPDIATLIRPAKSAEEILDPSNVKAIYNSDGWVYWFSRASLPYLRDRQMSAWNTQNAHYIHLGLYAFKGDAIRGIKSLQTSKYERLEKLEQLRWLENGYRIKTAVVHEHSFGIDTPEDYERAKRLI